MIVTITGINPNSGRSNTRKIRYHYGNRQTPELVPIGCQGAGVDGLMPLSVFNEVLKFCLDEIEPKDMWAFGMSTRVTGAEIKKRMIHMLKRAMLTQNGLIKIRARTSATAAKENDQKLDVETDPKYGIFYKKPEESARTTLICGSSFSGKTTFLAHELNKLKNLKNPCYDRIFIFTESPNSKPLQDLDPELMKRVRIYPTFVPKCVQLLKQVNDRVSNRFNFLVILDDVVSGIRSGTFMKMVLTMRNANISTCILLQYVKLITPAQRNSFHNVYVTNIRNEDWLYILEGFIGSLIKDRWPEAKNYKELSEILRHYFAKSYRKILHYCQVEDWVKEFVY